LVTYFTLDLPAKICYGNKYGRRERRVEVTGRQERRRKQLLDGLKEARMYYKLKKEALDSTVWRTRC
jgi:hypothetical protein